MELTYYGANCLKIVTKKASIVVDDNLASLGAKTVAKNGDILLSTFAYDQPVIETPLNVDMPGDYEVSDVSIQGVAARGHMDEKGTQKATIYKISNDEISVVVLGHVFAEITDEELEDLGHVDVLVIPTGGHGYTLDGVGALNVIKKIEPRMVIPTHFADSGIQYEVPQDDLAIVLKELAMEPKDAVGKLKLKAADIPETLELVVLERQ